MTMGTISKAVAAALMVFFLGVGALSVGAETRPSVSDFLGQVQATHDKMQSYSSSGEVTSRIAVPNFGPQEGHYTFSMKLARPNLYRIEWEQHAANMSSAGAVWSAGDGNFVTVPGRTTPLQPKDMPTALSMATGLSGGVAASVPAIFFDLINNVLKASKGAAFKPDAEVEGDPCYVIAEKNGAIGMTLWISKKSKLLRQIRDDYNGPFKFPEMNDEEAKKVIESMGQAPTDAAIKQMKAQMANARAMMSSGMTGFSVQVQRQIVVNAGLHKGDFAPRGGPAGK